MGKGTTLTMEEVERLEVKPLQRKLLEVSIFCLMMALYWKNCLYKEFYQNIEKLQNFAKEIYEFHSREKYAYR